MPVVCTLFASVTAELVTPTSDPGKRDDLVRRLARCASVAVKRKKKKRNEEFSFPFLRIRKIKRTVSKPEHSFFFFLTLTAPNSVCL